MTRGKRGTYPGVNFEPPYDPANDPELRTKESLKRAAVIGGTTVGVPGYLYARGLKGENKWSSIPTKLKRAEVFRKAFAGGAPPPVGHTTQGIVSAMRKGVAASAIDVATAGRTVWENLRAAGRGIRGTKLSARHSKLVELNAKMDGMIQFANSSSVTSALAAQLAMEPDITRPYVHHRRKPDDKKKQLPKLGAVYGVGGLTGAGIATGSLATRKALGWTGGKLANIYRLIRG